jgi:hypothetical protein
MTMVHWQSKFERTKRKRKKETVGEGGAAGRAHISLSLCLSLPPSSDLWRKN